MRFFKQRKTSPHRHAERGNVLFFIFIAIILFAALSFTVGNMMRGSGGAEKISEEKAALLATEILGYGRAMRQAIQDMKISNGCRNEDIRFVDTQTTGYGTSVRSECDVFDPAGGDINYIAPSAEMGTGTEWLFVGSNIVDGVGTTAPDVVMILQNINQTVCDAINEQSGITTPGSDSTINFTKFTGSFASTETMNDANGQMFGCLNFANSGDNLFYYQVLIAR